MPATERAENTIQTNARTDLQNTDSFRNVRGGQSNAVYNDENSVVLLEFSFRNLLIVTLGAPLIALFISFLLGFCWDYQQILDYEWTCGVSFLTVFQAARISRSGRICCSFPENSVRIWEIQAFFTYVSSCCWCRIR